MAKELRDNVSRVKGSSPLGRAVFVGLRAADSLLQYSLVGSWAARIVEIFGGRSVSPGWIIDPSSGYLRPYYSIIFAMSLGSSLKQIIAILAFSEQELPVADAISIALFNTIFNSLNSVFSIWAVTSQTSDPRDLNKVALFGFGAYLVGILTEMTSELQRTQFKKDPANKGKPYARGLFSLARHINYGGYIIWRAAFALTGGGFAWGVAVFLFFFLDFAKRGVPVLDKYLSERYKDEWEAIKARVPYKLIPGIY